MPQPDRLSACPSCTEPLEEGDLFCGACGADLRAAPPPQDGGDRPTIPVAGVRTRPDAAGNGPAHDRPGHVAPEPPPYPPDVGRNVPPAAEHPSTEPDFALPPATAGTPAVGPEAHERAAGEAPLQSSLAALAQAAPGPPDPAGTPASAPHSPAAPAPSSEPPPGPVPAPGTPDPRLRDDTPDTGGDPARSGNAVPAGPRCVACGTGGIDDDGYCEHCGHKQPLARDHWEQETEGPAAASDRGLRHRRNEDFFSVASAVLSDGSPASIAVVCDGVSSATRSDEASAAAAEAASASMRESLPHGVHTQQAMHDALLAAAEAVNSLATEAEKDPQVNAPACTIVGAVVAGGILTVGWIGDSRAYWVPEDRTAQPARLTEDDSWAAQMVAAGLMNEAEAYADARAHAITGWLGADAYEIDPHTASFKPDRTGVVVVCTDGLWNYAETAEEMAAAVPPDAVARPLHSARQLVGYALDGGGQDNVTVAVVPFLAERVGAGSA